MNFPSPRPMAIAKAKRIVNWRFLNRIRDSDGLSGIRGNKTISPLNITIKMVASRRFPVILLMIKREPLHYLGVFKLRSRITSQPIINRRLKITGVSEIRIQILVPHPNMQLMPTFDAPAPTSSVPGAYPPGISSGIIRQSYWSF
ncbi:hypothetical protein TNCV_4647571 [Trichonephila clavipes]|uniref:Uncharacterized protein n=1 Tax=Trichonephila clavipes TaxID=2585209 RepID=A0A8X6SX64_TRICX|nr:hypothetical protein TNCV_4647571 [Trichonephila clavipes]